jgi:hypothetical protein
VRGGVGCGGWGDGGGKYVPIWVSNEHKVGFGEIVNWIRGGGECSVDIEEGLGCFECLLEVVGVL